MQLLQASCRGRTQQSSSGLLQASLQWLMQESIARALQRWYREEAHSNSKRRLR